MKFWFFGIIAKMMVFFAQMTPDFDSSIEIKILKTYGPKKFEKIKIGPF